MQRHRREQCLQDFNPHIKVQRLMREMGQRCLDAGEEWLTAFDWTYFFHVSFPPGTSLHAAYCEMERGLRRLEGYGKKGLGWAIVIEIGRRGRHYHTHGLLHAPHLSRDEVRYYWDQFNNRVTRYDPNRRGVRYVLKDYARGRGEDFLFKVRGVPHRQVSSMPAPMLNGEAEEVSFA